MNIGNMLLSVLAVGIIGAYAYKMTATPAPAAAPEPAPVAKKPVKFDTCYKEKSVTGLKNVDVDAGGLPKGWHYQTTGIVSGTQQTPSMVPKDIAALPNLAGYGKLPHLYAALAAERKEGRNALFKLVSGFGKLAFDDIFRTDSKTRDKVRQILYHWAKVEGADPNSRGHLIDAREVYFYEKLTGEAYLQIGKYPNPTVVSASFVQEAFNNIIDHYYSRLVWSSASGFLFKGLKQPDETGNRFVLREDAWKTVAARAKPLGPDDKLKFWENALLAIPNYHEGLSAANREILTRVVGASGITLPEVEKNISKRRTRIFWDAEGRSLQYSLTYSGKDYARRQVCYSWVAGIYPDVAVRMLP